MPQDTPNRVDPLLAGTRRQFFGTAGVSLGALALGSLLAEEGLAAASAKPVDPLLPRAPHFAPRAKQVVFLFMAGGPSQLELFDFKPKLQELDGQVVPPSYTKNKRFAFIKGDAKLLGTRRKFVHAGQCGAELSELLPRLATIVDDVCIVKSMVTDVFNHGPAKLFVNTGSSRFGLPSMGAWLTYGIGSESRDLPGFVVLQSGPRGPRGGNPLWGSGFLPTAYQGVPLLNGPEPILNLSNPAGIDRARQSEFFSTVEKLNRRRLETVGDPEIATRIAAYEMAYRMQSSAPELIDFSGESKATLDAYGAEPGKPSFANNCLLARRLVERGVRFVQLYHTDCREVDGPAASLVADLKQRGMLDDTLVIWGGEFGRTPMGEPRDLIGRDHHVDGYTMWLAGGGIRGGQTIGATDELGYYAVEDRTHVHDLQATILHLLGLDHLKLTYRFQGRDFRLTDVGGNVVRKLLA
jgi:Protein of unknown function (DUF1501)